MHLKELIFLIYCLSLVLAVPYGFVGVRGKKSQTDVVEPNSLDNEDFLKPYVLDDDRLLLNYLLRQDVKQNYPPHNWDDLYYYEKRVPQGFTAVRGKRGVGQHA